MKPPTGIDRLTPTEAWEDGYRHGREELASEYQRDALAAAVAESPAGVKERDERIAAVEGDLRKLRTELGDESTVVRDLMRRLEKVEEGPKYLMTDHEVGRVAEEYARFLDGKGGK